MTTYKTTATIHKEGNTPIEWTHFSDKKLTKTECEISLSVVKEAGKTRAEKVVLKNFKSAKAGA